MTDVSVRYDGLEYYTLRDIWRWVQRWSVRAFATIVTHKWRRRLFPRYWPASRRRWIGMATEDELIDLNKAATAKAEAQRIDDELRGLSKIYKRLLINSLAKAGAAYMFTDEGYKYVRKVKINRVLIDRDGSALYYFIDVPALPNRVLISFLRHPDVVETLSGSCQRVVECHWDAYAPERGFAYSVQLRQGTRGIPRHVDYSDAFSTIDPNKHRPLTVIVGKGQGGNTVLADLETFPHLIVAGCTGTGKSVWISQAIITLCLRNKPHQLQLLLADLKGGVDFKPFTDLPHVIEMVKEPNEVENLLRKGYAEVERRMKIFESLGVANISQYRRRRFLSSGNLAPMPNLPNWIIIIDELANVMLDRKLKEESEILLANFSRAARAFGLHLIIATQSPRVDVVTGLIKANISVRLAFGTSSQRESMVIIDTGEAMGLKPSGRMIYMNGKDKLELQGPWIGPEMIAGKIADIAAGKREEALEQTARHGFVAADVLLYAIKKLGGKVASKSLFEHFSPLGMHRSEIDRIIDSLDGQPIEVYGEYYTFERGKAPRPNMLRRIELPSEQCSDEHPSSFPDTVSSTIERTDENEGLPCFSNNPCPTSRDFDLRDISHFSNLDGEADEPPENETEIAEATEISP